MTAERPRYQFNPQGTMWRVNGERAVFGAGPTALHEQISYLPVALALRKTGRLEANPLLRLTRNAEAGFGLIYGSPQEVEAISRRVNAIHQTVHGEIPYDLGAYKKGDLYNAQDQEALGIVGATLIKGSLDGYEMFVHGKPLPDNQRNEYVREAKQLFGFLGLQQESLPSTYDGVANHIQNMVDTEKLIAGGLARELAPYTMLSHTPIRRLIMTYIRHVTAELLPEKLRDQFGYEIRPGEKRALKEAARGIRVAVRHLPNNIRYTPNFIKAEQELAA